MHSITVYLYIHFVSVLLFYTALQDLQIYGSIVVVFSDRLWSTFFLSSKQHATLASLYYSLLALKWLSQYFFIYTLFLPEKPPINISI